jgi:Flp pilus assembly protein TadG
MKLYNPIGQGVEMRGLARLKHDRSGSVAVIFGIVLPVVICATAAAIDYGLLVHRRGQLQNAADAGALAAARELSLARPNSDGVAALARSIIVSSVPNPNGLTVDSRVVGPAVEVAVRETTIRMFGSVLGGSTSDLVVRATARVAATRLCMLALETEKGAAIDLHANARLTAQECSVYSNSKDKKGIVAADSSMVDAETVCSAGGIDGKGRFVRPPITDCPQIADPLADRPQPTVGACEHNKTEVKAGSQILKPGVYCGGLKVTNGATVTLSPGIYIVQGGKLTVDKGATLEGEGVGFFLAGKDSSFEFAYDSTINLAAPRAGDMAGILVFDDRSGKFDKHRIYSNNARQLLGTIYMPNGSLYIDAKRPIADRSAYTVIVARTVELYDGPDLVLNSDYNASSVPVPKGVGPMGSTISLVK